MIVKICGLRRLEDLRCAQDLGANFLGFILGVPESPRNNSLEEVRSLFEACPNGPSQKALLFRSSPLAEVMEAVDALGPDVIHLCGTEDAEFRHKLRDRYPDLDLWQSVGIPVDDPNKVEWIDRVQSSVADDAVSRVVLDSAKGGKTGGVGRAFPTDVVRRELGELCSELILAGGLNPQNVKERIDQLNPAGVDVSSGVESSPGEKSRELIKDFFNVIRGQ